ncbi:VOC family protein [candidate division KSB1 bacterium]|nr:VOC family protein [candidate division KSB1 bacterium]
MNAKYVHTNIIASDWKKLAAFYQTVFGCTPVPPERDLRGDWLDKGTAVKNAHIRGMHLRLPGHGEHGPTLEILQYDTTMGGKSGPANHVGLRHIAFLVDDVQRTRELVLKNNGGELGEIVEVDIHKLGTLVFVYLTDPEGNIIEIQQWK